MAKTSNYDESSIKSLDWKEHIRMRPGMYIGKLGDGSAFDDGIYVLVKEVMDNCIDEYTMGYGKTVELTIESKTVNIRDYGRGIPLGKVVDVVSKINTGAKYDSKAFQKSVGLNGVGTKAVNALSNYFKVTAFREGKEKTAEFQRGVLIKEYKESKTDGQNGTLVSFIPDDSVFKNFKFHPEFLENQIWNYCFLNAGLKIVFNGKTYVSKNGLLDLLQRKTNEDEIRYPIIHLADDDIEVAMTHNNDYGEDIYSFVNGQHTTQGGTHQQASETIDDGGDLVRKCAHCGLAAVERLETGESTAFLLDAIGQFKQQQRALLRSGLSPRGERGAGRLHCLRDLGFARLSHFHNGFAGGRIDDRLFRALPFDKLAVDQHLSLHVRSA